jgi:hypothetical protein
MTFNSLFSGARFIATSPLNPNGHFMQDLIRTITAETGLDSAKAEKAVGILLTLVATQGNKPKVKELFEKLPGAQELATAHGSGFMGILAGGLMGGPLAMVTKMQAAGLTVEQVKQVGTMTFAHAKKMAGISLVRDAASNIPGLNSYI